jgi:hypothetical protein
MLNFFDLNGYAYPKSNMPAEERAARKIGFFSIYRGIAIRKKSIAG